MVWTATPDGVVDYVNHVFQDYTGHSAESINNKGWLNVLHPDDQAPTLQVWTHAAQTRTPYRTEFRLFHAAGNDFRWHYVAADPHFGPDGEIVRWFGVTADIHDSKLAEKALADAQRKLQRVLALQALEARVLDKVSAQQPLSDILDDVTGTVDTLISDGCSSVLLVENGRLRHGSAPGLPEAFNRFVHNTAIGEGVGSCGTAAARKQPVIVTDITCDPLWAPYSRWVPVLGMRACWSTPVLTLTGDVLATFALYHRQAQAPSPDDLALIDRICQFVRVAIERIRHLEQLRHAQRLEAVGKLTGGIAHDFNNLLTVILGNADQLVDELPDGEEHRELARDIKTAARRGADLVRSLMAFSRQQVLDPKPVQINTLVRRTRLLFERALGGNITLALKLHEPPGASLLDAGQFENALLNLLLNARDAMPDGGIVSLRTAMVDEQSAAAHGATLPEGNYNLVEVRDTGHGMDEQTLRHVFEPFFTTKDVGKGSGLGLSMVHGFVQQSSGHIHITSTPGTGTRVCLYFPCLQTRLAAVVQNARKLPGDGTEPS